MTTFEQGDQVAYLPPHVGGALYHPDVELGFVTSAAAAGGMYYCRFWQKGRPGALRTVANSECTPVDCMVKHHSVDQTTVNRLLVELGYKVTA